MFIANLRSASVSIIDLKYNSVTNVPLGPDVVTPQSIIFDLVGQRLFTTNFNSDSISIIDLANSNNVTNVPLGPSVEMVHKQ